MNMQKQVPAQVVQGAYIDIRTAAERLGVCTETLRRWDNSGKLTAKRTPGNYRRFLEADVDAILAGAQ